MLVLFLGNAASRAFHGVLASLFRAFLLVSLQAHKQLLSRLHRALLHHGSTPCFVRCFDDRVSSITTGRITSFPYT